MFSLSDEIQKFEKTVLTLPENIMTIDERFLGGGIKMEDLIRENSFIITEMRKFKSVFLNYCKLNDKVYKKIIEHEVNANEHMNKVVTLSSTIDRKVQDAMTQVKNIKQYLINKFDKLSEQTEQNFKQVKQQLNTKASQINFKQRIKSIIEQYQQQNASASSVAVVSDNQNNVGPIAPSSTRKRRGLTLQDIEAFKSQITPLIDQVSQRVNAQNTQIADSNTVISSLGVKIQKLEINSKWLSDDIIATKNQIKQIKAYADIQDQKIQDMLKQTINENVWTQRFQEFRQKILVPAITTLNQKLYKGIYDVRKQIDELRPKFVQINGQITKIKEKAKSVQSKINKNDHKFQIIEKKIQLNREQFIRQIQQSNKKNQKMIKSQLSQRQIQIDDVHKSISSIKKSISQITNTTEDAVLKKVQNKLGRQMREIKSDIQGLNNKILDINKNITANRQQMGHVKDLVATKANYSDLVLYFDKKADKKQFKQLQELVADSPKASNHSGICQEGFLNDLNRKSSDQKRKKRRSSYSKRITTPFNTKPEQDSGRYLHIGWGDSPEVSRQLTKTTHKQTTNNLYTTLNARNKSMRPSTANTLFLL